MVGRKSVMSIMKSGIPFCLPFVLLVIIGFFVIPNTIEYIKEVIAFGFLSAALWIFSILFLNFKVRRFISYVALVLLFLLLAIKLSFYSHYGVKISGSALFVIFETNGAEASDFLANYFNFKVISLLIVCSLIFYLAVIFLKNQKDSKFEFNTIIKICGVLIICLSVFIIYSSFMSENIIISSIKSYSEYKIVKANLKKNLAQPLSNNILVESLSNNQQTYIVVIGESTSRWHMQLYGYERETNPKLTEIKDELIIFNNAITPNVHTLRALEKIMTLSDFSLPNKDKNASLVQMGNASGFNTFWISNQKPVGIYESIPTIISNAAHNKNYVNTNDSGYDIYDEAILPYLDKALNDNAQKKLIFLHLIGTHTSYKKRYPVSFEFFNNETNTVYKHEKSKRLINEYDNAVRYNDFILREIIEKVRSKNENSYVVYFSDHGDEVYDTFDFVGHNEYHGSKPMYEIPFIAWFSETYKQNNTQVFQINNLQNRRYIMEDFIHGFSEISKISFDKFDSEKSIFNQKFKEKTRYIRKGEDYDKR